MTDIELLRLAAKAAGIAIVPCTCRREAWPFKYADIGDRSGHWSSLTDSGDALRLAVALELDVQFFRSPAEVHASTLNDVPVRSAIEPYGDDRGAATRRAITRAAAEIGAAMP